MAEKRIAIPVAEKRLALHFGHCQEFALVDVDDQANTIVNTAYVPAPPHQPGLLPRWLHEQGVHVIIAGGMGQRAQGLFLQAGIDVVVGAASGVPEQVVRAYLEGMLETGENLCDH
ncbi:MAG TPA: ATPase [Candidatus Hydrogenedentes bacterium]|nr:ATPase [Candidatus Hydrogenedentota bacterium]